MSDEQPEISKKAQKVYVAESQVMESVDDGENQS